MLVDGFEVCLFVGGSVERELGSIVVLGEALDGAFDGTALRLNEGIAEGLVDGDLEGGVTLGIMEGEFDGIALGLADGEREGRVDEAAEITREGMRDGAGEGDFDDATGDGRKLRAGGVEGTALGSCQGFADKAHLATGFVCTCGIHIC